MKRNKTIISVLLALIAVGSCKQEVITLEAPPTVTPTTPSKGNADFTKFVAFGSSYVAGMQAQALFNESQTNSLAKILATQFATVGGGTFNQPDINSVNGFNPVSSNLGLGLILGRLILFDPDGSGPRTAAPYPAKFPGSSVTCPSAVTTPALPAPYNTADLPAAYSGTKSALNNFGVPLIYAGQTLTPDAGNPSKALYSPFYARFASSPGVSTIVGDAKTAAGTFYLIWLGFEDVLLNAATGDAGVYPMTSSSDFTTYFGGAVTTLLTGTSFKGVVGNIPDFTSLPYFYTVTWNNITLDATTAATVTTNLANNYNAFLNGMVNAGVISSAERDKRKLTYVAGKNGVLMNDDELTDLSPYMAGPYAGLLPFAKTRQATSTDLILLTAGSILGTCYNNSPTAVYGVSFPVGDQYVLTASETTSILTRSSQFNTTIGTVVSASGGRLVLADVRKAYADLVTNKAYVSDNVMITPSFAPPTGAYSEDGLNPNNRGYAFTANVFIDAINTGFAAAIPKASLANYTATKLPVNP